MGPKIDYSQYETPTFMRQQQGQAPAGGVMSSVKAKASSFTTSLGGISGGKMMAGGAALGGTAAFLGSNRRDRTTDTMVGAALGLGAGAAAMKAKPSMTKALTKIKSTFNIGS